MFSRGKHFMWTEEILKNMIKSKIYILTTNIVRHITGLLGKHVLFEPKEYQKDTLKSNI